MLTTERGVRDSGLETDVVTAVSLDSDSSRTDQRPAILEENDAEKIVQDPKPKPLSCDKPGIAEDKSVSASVDADSRTVTMRPIGRRRSSPD